MNDRVADTTIAIGADFSGAQRAAASFQKSVDAAADVASSSFRLVTRNSEKARKSLAKVSDETKQIKRQSRGLIDAFESDDFVDPRTTLRGRLENAGKEGDVFGQVGALTGGTLGIASGVKGALAGAGGGFLLGELFGRFKGFFEPEIEDALDLSPPEESKVLLRAVDDLEAGIRAGRETFKSTVAKASLAFRSSPFLDDADTEALSSVLRGTREIVQRYEEQKTRDLLRLDEIFENAPESIKQTVLDRMSRRFGGPLGDGSGSLESSGIPGRASGGSVAPGLAFLVGERGPEIFVPDRAGRILPNSFLSSGNSVDLDASFAGLTDEVERLGMAIDEALGDLPEEFGLVADAIDGVLNEALAGNIRSWEDLRDVALGAAHEVLSGILQSEEVRAEIGELADVIDGVLNQALNGSIDSWEDLGRVALDVLQQIATEILKTQLAGQGGGGGFLGAVGDQSEFLVAA